MSNVIRLSDYRPQAPMPPAMWKRIAPGHWQLTDGTRCWATITPHKSEAPRRKGERYPYSQPRFRVDVHAPEKSTWALLYSINGAQQYAAGWLRKKVWDAPRILERNAS